MRRSEDRVAVVGIGGLFPGAGDLAAFWTNVRDARDGSSDPPRGRWPVPPERVLDPRPVAPDKVPTLRGYYLIESNAGTVSVSLFEDEASTKQSNEEAASWLSENLPGVSADNVVGGEVV